VFVTDSAYLSVAREWRDSQSASTNESHSEHQPEIIKFQATSANVPTFSASTLKPRQVIRLDEEAIAFAGIPLHPHALAEEEAKITADYTEVLLRFHDVSGEYRVTPCTLRTLIPSDRRHPFPGDLQG
jgi:hypothetical protein